MAAAGGPQGRVDVVRMLGGRDDRVGELCRPSRGVSGPWLCSFMGSGHVTQVVVCLYLSLTSGTRVVVCPCRYLLVVVNVVRSISSFVQTARSTEYQDWVKKFEASQEHW